MLFIISNNKPPIEMPYLIQIFQSWNQICDQFKACLISSEGRRLYGGFESSYSEVILWDFIH